MKKIKINILLLALFIIITILVGIFIGVRINPTKYQRSDINKINFDYGKYNPNNQFKDYSLSDICISPSHQAGYSSVLCRVTESKFLGYFTCECNYYNKPLPIPNYLKWNTVQIVEKK